MKNYNIIKTLTKKKALLFMTILLAIVATAIGLMLGGVGRSTHALTAFGFSEELVENLAGLQFPLAYKTTYEYEGYYESKSGFVPLSSSNRAFAGDEIRELIGRIGTVAANAICNATGQFGVLTNQHVARNRRMRVGGNWVGTSAPHQQQLGGTIDAAFIPFENQNNWIPTPQARSGSTTFSNIRLGTEAQIIQAHAQHIPVSSIGRTSGIQQSGRITSTLQIVNSLSNNITAREYLVVRWASASACTRYDFLYVYRYT